MRDADEKQNAMFIYFKLNDRILTEHHLRRLRTLVEAILTSISSQNARVTRHRQTFGCAREAIACFLMQVLDTIRSKRQLMEKMDFNLLLFHWFLDLARR